MESPKIAIHVVEKSTQNHHQNCKPKITSHNQTQIEKEEEEEEEEEEDLRRRRKRKKEKRKRRNNKQAECGK